MPIEKDPVCGMSVDTELAAAREEFEGKLYYFCSQGCHQRFLAEPRRFLSAS